MKSSLSSALFLISFFLAIPLYAKGDNTTPFIFTNRIAEEKFVLINGIEQWITIKGESSKPVILFLHGGPGSPLSPYADALYSAWEKDFILVQWDQRGTGKTFGRNAPTELTPEYFKSNPLLVEQVANDGIALVEYLVKHLGKSKIILFGTSWGSVPGIKMAAKRPELFLAYVGHSQVVNPTENFIPTYKKLYQMVQNANDAESLDMLNTIGAPPYAAAKNTGKFIRVIKKYEKQSSIAPPASWMTLSSQYNNEKDEQHRNDGDDYSFLNYAGDTRLGVQSMASTINLAKDNLSFAIPIYFIQGEEDILTPQEVTKEYFDKIDAAKKEYFLLPKTAHGFNLAVLEAQYKIFRQIGN